MVHICQSVPEIFCLIINLLKTLRKYCIYDKDTKSGRKSQEKFNLWVCNVLVLTDKSSVGVKTEFPIGRDSEIVPTWLCVKFLALLLCLL